MMTYTAKDIGREVVRLSVDNRYWVSNLKLQKLLYFSWLDYFRETGDHLFDEQFQAWKYGPVVPSVYYDNWCNAANTLYYPKRTSEPIDSKVSNFLLRMLREFDDKTVGEMVNLSHASKPWSDNYVPGQKMTIPLKDMEEEACHSSTWKKRN